MKRITVIFIALFLLTGVHVFAQDDVLIDESGNVITGNSNVNGGNLEVLTTGEDGIVSITNGADKSGIYGQNEGSGYGVQGLSNTGIGGYFNSNSGPGLVVGSGNVGIGTLSPSPAYNLDVVGTINASTAIKVNGTDVLTSYTETDPVFGASPASGITAGKITNWDVAYGWGDHSTAGYLTSYTETDPQVGGNITNYVPKWDGSALVTGTIYDNGNIGIGTFAIGRKLVVAGDARVQGPDGFIDIGTINPIQDIEVVRDQTVPGILATGYRDLFSAGVFTGRKARGTMASPSAVLTDDVLAAFGGYGYGATGWPASGPGAVKARMQIVAAEDWTNSAQGAYINFLTTPVGALSKAEVMRITGTGVGIGTTQKLSRLTITPAADVSDIGGTTTANTTTAIIGINTTFLSDLGIGDRISLSSAATTYSTVTAIASDTSLTVDTALGDGSSQTINKKSSILRLDDASNATQLVVNDLGNVGIGTPSPAEKLTVAGTIESTSGGIKFPNGTVQTTAIAAGQQCAAGEAVTGFDQNGNIICSNYVSYAIGDLGPAGGIVFYVYAGGLHGLEAAPQDQSAGAQWGCNGTAISGADGAAVGTGAQNTADILAGCSESGIAARIAHDYSLNGYIDWFLPSTNELDLLFQQRAVVGGFADYYYWSSTEYDNSSALTQYFLNGIRGNAVKNSTLRVRVVRAF
jgi:hypothetical protein